MGGAHAGSVGGNAAKATPPSETVTIETVGQVLVLRIDDGKRNALNFELLDTLIGAISEPGDVRAIAIIGRPGCFSAGFDLKIMQTDQAMNLFTRGGELALAIFESKVPVVYGVTGHCLAMGAVLLCAADVRIGERVTGAKLGLNEVRIGMPIPEFGVELARARLDPRHFEHAVQLAEVVGPDRAVDIGWLDEVVDAGGAETRALEVAAELAENLHPKAFAITRKNTRGPLAEKLKNFN